ncbi:MAG: bifunctional oligoribonuclease/PAP phosphatase NrnA [Thermanaeromonas sp.]|uniref:DHH family phosphoesterase n=1 Tax=Thermanaeromonas sp. TaxID=2003697 RepID=UPI002440E523|nr:bifunctional oligoribonuclease/PAP phosphatase NrnA [Thermanaeromonas sp.]MCG0277264.1 bifunctional oligoribonuclease/PAP phosphatase NrnA [Thermanaeromonas sp.]
MNTAADIAADLVRAKEVIVASHRLPDGDCIGSTLALTRALGQLGARVAAVIGDPVPEMYRFLPGSEDILLPDQVTFVPSLLVVVDCTDLERVAEGFGSWKQKVERVINIDHHTSNTLFGDFNLVDEEAAATGELIYAVLKEMDGLCIDSGIATALYTALVTDTGSFQFENCRARTLRIAADLLDLGADLALIREYLWENKPLLAIRLLAEVLPTLSLAYEGKVAWLVVKREVMDRLGAKGEHAEGLVNYPRSIAGVEVAAVFRELEPGVVKVALRSKKQVDVNEVAALFGGGGHRRAAGCLIRGSIEEAVEQVIRVVGDRLDHGGRVY